MACLVERRSLHLPDVLLHLTEMVDDHPLPTALVAHQNDTYLGSAFLIDCDLGERQEYKPWVAAVWVEEKERGRGLGRSLVQSATRVAASLGYPVSYVCCQDPLVPFYTAFGWAVVERNVGSHDLAVLSFKCD